MLGDLIYEAKGKIVGQRILAVAPQAKIENTILLDGIIHGIVNIIDTGTFVSTAIDDTVYYSQGQGVITTKDRREVATWTAQGIKQYSIRDENDNNNFYIRNYKFYLRSSSCTPISTFKHFIKPFFLILIRIGLFSNCFKIPFSIQTGTP